ncbi:MAG: translation elongation factor Ts [Nitrospinota bacterium]
MDIPASLVKSLREKSGAGIMDCKAALVSTGGDLDKAIDFLRQKGLADAGKKAGRSATEGLVYAYIHPGGRIGVLVEVNCETDFVARTPQFQELVKDVAMQVAASNPLCVTREEVPPDVLERERAIYEAQARETGKPEKVIEKIVQGKLNKFYREDVLMEQAFVKDPDKDLQTLVKEKIGELGENITIRRFARYLVGEGLERQTKSLADEVQEQIAKV